MHKIALLFSCAASAVFTRRLGPFRYELQSRKSANAATASNSDRQASADNELYSLHFLARLASRANQAVAFNLAAPRCSASGVQPPLSHALGSEASRCLGSRAPAWRMEEVELEEETPLPETVSRTLGPKHPWSIFWRNKEGLDLKAKGDTLGAFEVFLEVLDLRKSVLGDVHEDTIDTKTCVAETLEALGEIDAAAELRQEIVANMIDIRGAEDAWTQMSLQDLEKAKKAAKDPALARSMQQFRSRNLIPGKSMPPNGMFGLQNSGFTGYDQGLDPETPSHQKLECDENGVPLELRFVHVDEEDCVGCTYCSNVAGKTFKMEGAQGRARAITQGLDDPETIAEAINCCPVNCIAYVDLEDLIILEAERENIKIDPVQAAFRGYQSSSSRRTRAKFNFNRPVCGNCPTNGCKDCPMYGVGNNPVYLAKMEQRKAAAEERERAQQERDAAVMTARLDGLLGVGWREQTKDVDMLAAFGDQFDKVNPDKKEASPDIADGISLAVTEEGPIFESPTSDAAIDTAAVGATLTAAGPPVDVDGYRMVPLRPRGAVEARIVKAVQPQDDQQEGTA